MADRRGARQPVDYLAAGEGVADEAEPPLGVKSASVEGNDARGLLAAMLQRVQSECGDRGGIGVAEDAEHAAFLAQRVAFKVGISQVQIGWVEVQIAEIQVAFCGFIGRALYLVHCASFLA